MEDASGRFYKGDTTPKEVRQYRPKVNVEELVSGLTLEKLHAVFTQVLKRQQDKIDPVRSRFGTIEKEEVSLPDKLEAVASYAKQHRNFSFRDLLRKQRSRTQIVVTFLAVLELMKYGLITASQKETDDDILIEQAPDADLESVREQLAQEEFV